MKEKLKSRNGGKWTEGRFEGFIKSTLRGGMRRWPPKWSVLAKSVVGRLPNKKSGRLAIHHRCNGCNGVFPKAQVQVDHIIPVGFTKTWDDYIERLYCEIENLQVLCKKCHKKKTKIDNQTNRKTARRKLRSKPSTNA